MNQEEALIHVRELAKRSPEVTQCGSLADLKKHQAALLQMQECPDGSIQAPMSPREVAIAKSELTARPTGMLGKLLCRFGKHDLQTLRLDHNTLNGGMPSGALYECRRCGQIQEWVAAWDQACCIGKWPTLRSFLDSQNV